MKNKLKTIVITVSRTFPSYHPKAGQPTYFVEKIQLSLGQLVQMPGDLLIDLDPKLHTFRGNFKLWEKRIKKVLDGKAIISLRHWSGKPYNSSQVEIMKLDKNSGIGIQEAIYKSNFEIPYDGMAVRCEDGFFRDFPFYLTAENDGLNELDFANWFEKGKYDLTEPMACIHFTPFRYERK